MKVEYINGLPLYLFIHKDSSQVERGETRAKYRQLLNFEFEGDVQYFLQEYKTDLPVFSGNKLNFFDKFKVCNDDYKVVATIDKDSVHYDFLQYCPQGNVVLNPRKYRVIAEGGDIIRDIEKYCEETFKDRDLDTSFFFQGIVERDGRLTDIQVIRANHTPMERFLLELFQQSDKLWQPAIQGGRPIRIAMKIYVKFKDGNCQIATTDGWYTAMIQ